MQGTMVVTTLFQNSTNILPICTIPYQYVTYMRASLAVECKLGIGRYYRASHQETHALKLLCSSLLSGLSSYTLLFCDMLYTML